MLQRKNKVAVYPGSFDPFTYGHLDIVKRACLLFERVIIAIADNEAGSKRPLFTAQERVELGRSLIDSPNVELKTMHGLFVDFARDNGAQVAIRGLRAVSDFDFEFKLTMVNTRLYPELETVFLMASEENQFTSSSFVKEIAALGGDISPFVPPPVTKAIRDKLRRQA